MHEEYPAQEVNPPGMVPSLTIGPSKEALARGSCVFPDPSPQHSQPRPPASQPELRDENVVSQGLSHGEDAFGCYRSRLQKAYASEMLLDAQDHVQNPALVCAKLSCSTPIASHPDLCTGGDFE